LHERSNVFNIARRVIMQKKRVLVSCLFLLVILTACNGNTPTAPAALTSPTSVGYVFPPAPTHVNAPFVGDYSTIITTKDATPVTGAQAIVVPTAVGSLSTGRWVISFHANGYFVALGPNSNTSAQYAGLGQYKVKGDLLTIQDVKCWEFNGIGAYTATYRWTLQGQTLLLQVVGKENCPIRAVLLTSHHLTRQS
jgi:hypothetical protein